MLHRQGLLASPLQVLIEGKGNDHIVRAKHSVPFAIKPGLCTAVDVLVPFVFNASDSLELSPFIALTQSCHSCISSLSDSVQVGLAIVMVSKVDCHKRG